MELNEEQAKERLNSSKNLLNKLGLSTNRTVEKNESLEVVKLHNGGRHEGDKNIPPVIRGLISVAANVGTTKEAALAFGVSHHEAHDLKHGKVNDLPNSDLIEKRDNGLGKIHDKALAALMASMNLITPESLDGMKTKEVVMVAEKLASIVDKTREGNTARTPLVVIHAPRLRDENEFDVIEITAEAV